MAIDWKEKCKDIDWEKAVDTINRTLARVVLVLSIGLVVAATAKKGMLSHEYKQIKVNYATEVSTENWEVKAHIVTSGNVSENTIKKVCDIIKNDIHSEAWNYLVNSGGKLIIVEGDDIKDYILENYNCEEARKIDEKIYGYCPQFADNNDILQKVDVVIAADELSSLKHEFFHAFDYSHGYSSTEEFKSIYANAKDVCEQLFKTQKAIDYYSGNIQEYFAEMARMYTDGELNGVDPELENYLASVLS